MESVSVALSSGEETNGTSMDGSGTPECGQAILRVGQLSRYCCRKLMMSARVRSRTASLGLFAGGAGAAVSEKDGVLSAIAIVSFVMF